MSLEQGALGKRFTNGEVICRQGETGDRMFVIQSGKVEVVREEDGTESVVGTLGQGEIVGEMAIIDRQPRSATVRAKGDAMVLTLDKRAFLRHVHEDPSLAFNILEKMSDRIRSLDAEVARLKQESP